MSQKQQSAGGGCLSLGFGALVLMSIGYRLIEWVMEKL